LEKATFYGYSSGPMVSGSRVRFIDAKVLNNAQNPARVRVKQYDLLPAGKQLLLDYSLVLSKRESVYLGLILLDTWEVQFITDSPLLRCWLGCLDSDLNLEPGGVIMHSQFIRFGAISIQASSHKRQPEVVTAGFRQ